MGRWFCETVYWRPLNFEFDSFDISHNSDKELGTYYDSVKLMKSFISDFVCYNCIILEIEGAFI